MSNNGNTMTAASAVASEPTWAATAHSPPTATRRRRQVGARAGRRWASSPPNDRTVRSSVSASSCCFRCSEVPVVVHPHDRGFVILDPALLQRVTERGPVIGGSELLLGLVHVDHPDPVVRLQAVVRDLARLRPRRLYHRSDLVVACQ